MEIMRCPKGHFYDKEKADTCPVCAKNGCTNDPELSDDSKSNIVELHRGCSIRLDGIITITHDDMNDRFVVKPEHESLVRLNGNIITEMTILDRDDELMLGNTRVYLDLPQRAYGYHK